MDRMDIHIDVPAVSFAQLRGKERDSMKSDVIRSDVMRARDIQIKRFVSVGTVWA